MNLWFKAIIAVVVVQWAVLGAPSLSCAADTITITHGIKEISGKEVFCSAWLTCDCGEVKTDLMAFGESRTVSCPGAPICRPKWMDGYCDDWPFADMYTIERLTSVMPGAKYKIVQQGKPRPLVFQPY